jgi:hypothetical protein
MRKIKRLCTSHGLLSDIPTQWGSRLEGFASS